MERFALKHITGKLLLGAIVLLLARGIARAGSTGCDGSGNCYVYAAATGSGNGSSWANAYTGFGTGAGQVNPASMTRGVTYWISNGSYGPQTFSSPASGTTVITIEGATASSHGPDSTWSNSYAGQALFTGITLSTAYWVVNGQAVSGCSYPNNNTSCYTIKIWNQTDGSSDDIEVEATNETIEYVECEGTGMTGGNFPSNTTTGTAYQDNGVSNEYDGAEANVTNNLYVGYSYLHHFGGNNFLLNMNLNSGLTVEYCWIAYNHTQQSTTHSEAMSVTYSDFIIRYSVFQDICSSAQISDAAGGSPTLSNWYIYGNIFFWDPTYAAYDGAGQLGTIDDGVVGFFGDTFSGNLYFTNNTMYGFANGYATQEGAPFATNAITGQSGQNAGSPTVVIENNLWVDCAYVYNDATPYCSSASCASFTEDYNASWQDGNAPYNIDWQTNSPAAAHDYNASGTSNPFVSATAYTLAGFDLATPDPFSSYPGATLSSSVPSGCTTGTNCLNSAGLTGNLFGAGATWDRGAEQLGSSVAPSPPTNLTATAH